MDARFYNSEEIDIERLSQDLINVYTAQGYQTQHIGTKDQMLVQIKKGGDLEALVGLQAALSLTIQHTGSGTLAMIGQQKWLDKAAVGAVGIIGFAVLWPLALTAGAGALRQASLGNQVLNILDGLVRQQRPDVQVGPVPAQYMPQAKQQWGTPPPAYGQQVPFYTPPAQQQPQTPPMYTPPQPPVQPMQAAQAAAPTKLRCANCNTPYEPGDTFCSGCGRSLTPAKIYCDNCHAEIKPGMSFCANCGSSTFQQTIKPSGSAAPPQTPSQAARPIAPTYTPPPAPPVQPKPMVPVYTPPAVPPTPPAQRVEQSYVAPTVSPKPQPAPEPLYVPPVTQNPPVQPQPKVTMIPATQQETPAAPPQPKPHPQYYIPSNQQAQQASSQQQLAASQPTVASQPVQQAQSTVDTTVPWAVLTFTSGNQVSLTGASALVGRYDHDLGGDKPAVDLSDQQGADTTSRVHAVFEHTGNASTLTDLNSTNSTRINNKRLEPDKATPVNDGDTILFGKVSCTFKNL
ncbi:MAG: hypothetical protein NVS4B12_26940 [Ktedonobacteraceae bacterium]